MKFIFPVEELQGVSGLEEARQRIRLALETQSLSLFCTYRFQLVRGQYIYCRCRSCTARLVFKKQGQRFVLHKANTFHQHTKLSIYKSVVLQAIQAFPSCLNIQSIRKNIMSRFGISSSTFYRYLRESKSFGKNIEDILKMLEAHGIFGTKMMVLQNDHPDLPSILILTSQTMIEKYNANGKNVKFDLTYNLIRQMASQEKQYAVGIFVTLNNNQNIQPVGMVITSDESTESFTKIFKQFFRLMRSPAQIMITDEQKTLQLALQKLREQQIFSGQHYIDMFHVLRNTKKSLFYKPNISYFVEMSQSSNIVEYNLKKSTYLSNHHHPRDDTVFQKFQEKMGRCCVALLPPIFVGLSCTTNSSEKMNDLIKSKIPYSQKYFSVVTIISKLMMKMVSKKEEPKLQKSKIQQFISIREVQILREKLCKNVFKRLMIQITLSLSCLVNLGDEVDSYFVGEESFDDSQHFTITYDPLQGKWNCECRLADKIGVPCAHSLKVILLRKEKIITAVNPWWIQQQNQQSERHKIRYPRLTRRR